MEQTAQPVATIAPEITSTPEPPPVLPSPFAGENVSPMGPEVKISTRPSFLDNNTLFTVYGVAFDTAPILGLLGFYGGFDEMETGIQKYTTAIARNNGGKGVIPAVHLIYGMATDPCPIDDDCLLYTEGRDIDVIKEYIEPAAKRGWHVILDSQLGRSDPVIQVKRMIRKGYLDFDNVHIALDPEFHTIDSQKIPGIPIGTVDAQAINRAQEIVSEHVDKVGLPHRKIMIVHQFGDPNVNDGVPFMIRDKKTLDTAFVGVDLVIDADGFGGQEIKIDKYNRMTDAMEYPFIKYRGIKIFHRNPHERAGHFDTPMMDMETLFGHKEAIDGAIKMAYMPDVIIIA